MHVILGPCIRIPNHAGIPAATSAPVFTGKESIAVFRRRAHRWMAAVLVLACGLPVLAQQGSSLAAYGGVNTLPLPPRVVVAQRFLLRHGRTPRRTAAPSVGAQISAGTAVWQPLGPAGVLTAHYGLVTGRISSLAVDPSDSTGNRLFAGTSGGGVWVSQNAAASDSAGIVFVPLTDNLAAMSATPDASLSIGALSVQPGGTGVILAGTGDPNDALDSYYGTGILRSTDGGKTWMLIQGTTGEPFTFAGEGFAGFAWSTVNPELVVAAVSQAWEGLLVNAQQRTSSYEGLYYSTDSGATWKLAQISDLNGKDVQGPSDGFTLPDGNAATAVVWNPIRRLFIAAVRYHGYYQSPDGAHWTRLAAQPGSGLTEAMCPTRPKSTGSPACPIYRGALAVNPLTGDTFAWTVDLDDQDQGIWQDACAADAGSCTNENITFAKQWDTTPLETPNSWLGSATIQDGSYNLALAAVPSGQDTILLAGDNDLWKCSLAMGCAWRNTTNAGTCWSAQVGGYQHAVEWTAANPLEVFIGNDSGLWRSMDAIGETDAVCSSSDAGHFQNLNGALGSLAEVDSMSAIGASPYTMMLGLGANGTAGVKTTSGPTVDWPQILTGEGGPVVIDPIHPDNWYVNNGAGVSIHLCSQSAPCTAADFGSNPAVSNADVNNDGLTMTTPAPFIVDPVDPAQLLIGTCRMWRGPASGKGWTSANAVSSMFDGNRTSSYCNGNSLVRSIAAMASADGGEIVYAGTYGTLNGGATLPGHVLSARMDAGGAWSAWNDLTLNPVSNDDVPMNASGLDISSLYIDTHDATGATIYATVAGINQRLHYVASVYRSTDGGAHWTNIVSNLPSSAANSLVVDPQDASTAYIAMDTGVYITRSVSTCGSAIACWSPFGSGLPNAPVVALSAAPATTIPNVLVGATFGRGVWQIPLATAGAQLTTATLMPSSLDFGTQGFGMPSSPKTVTLTNTGGIALLPGAVSTAGDFSETDTCSDATVNAGTSCTVQITFKPTQAGSRTGQLSIPVNIAGGSLSVALSGIGDTPGKITVNPGWYDFGTVKVGISPPPQHSFTVENSGGSAVAITSITVTPPFAMAANTCGTTAFAANSDCQLVVEFEPVAPGPASGTLTIVDGLGTHPVQLTGSGAAPPTGTLSTTSLNFPATIIGQSSAAQTVTLTNSGDLPLTSISADASEPFHLTTNCTAQLAGNNASCSLTVVFKPTGSGARTGTLTEHDSVNAVQTVSLSGTGLKPPEFSVSPASLTFAAQTVGAPSSPQSLTVKNIGEADAAGVDIAISGQQPAGSFSIASKTCGNTLAAGSTCTVQVVFTPVSSGGARANLGISSSNGKQFPGLPLAGTGETAAGLGVSPSHLTFAAQSLNQPSAPQTVTITNSGGTSADSLALNVSGPFSLAQNQCGVSLASGASCTTGVVFTPTSRGALTGALTVTSADVNTSAVVALSGIGGLTGAVQITPALVSFPTTGVGTTSSPATLTISNSSAAVALADLNLSVSAGFKLGNNTCGISIGAGAGCTVDVLFAPAAAGPQTGSLTLASSALAASVSVPLSGTGFDFQATTTGGSSQTVSSGQTATYSLALTPSSGSAGTFSLQCGKLPAYAGCTFNPSSPGVGANATGAVTLQITTSQASSAVLRPAGLRGWQEIPIVLAIVILPFSRRRGRNRLLLALFGILMAGAGMTACSSSGGGGGGTGPPPPPVTHTTPAGTYSIPVNITSCGVQHTVTLTLVVD